MITETVSIPTKLLEQYAFQETVVEMVTENATKWVILPAEVTALTAQQADYEGKYAVAANGKTQSPAVTEARNSSWEILEEMIINMYNHHLLNNPLITTDDKTALHINFTGRAPRVASDAPITTPVASFISEEIATLHVNFADSSNTGSHSKPHGVDFMEIQAKIGLASAPPASVDECNQTFEVSRNHQAIEFAAEDRGKTIFAYARWVTATGKKSKFSGMFSGLIP